MVIGLLLASVFSYASVPENSLVEPYLDKADALKLAETRTWRKLLVYESGSLFHLGLRSAVVTDDFFLAPDGKFNPESELRATVIALADPAINDPDLHAQCRFPARYQWLKSELGIPEVVMPEVHCPAFSQWSYKGAAKSLSIVFASGYLGNPASYYGHTLLKLNSKNSSRTQLLDTSVNFGAIVPDGEDPLSYILKGLFGGYNGEFSQSNYYFYTKNYGEIELRDLWEYELELTDKQVDIILAHTWEVMGKEYQYFFLNKNCSYRLGELLETIEGIKVNPDNKLWVIPQAQILELDRARVNGQPLVKSMRFQPSRQSRFYSRYSMLDEEQKQWVKDGVADPLVLENGPFLDVPLTTRYSVLDTMLDYYQFVGVVGGAGDQQEINSLYQKVLAQRYRLPPRESGKINSILAAPHRGRNPSLIQLGIRGSSELGDGLFINLRPAYYDPLDFGPEHVKYGELIMGQLQMSVYDSKVILEGVDFLSTKSLASEATGLPGDNRQSWQLKVGLQSVRFDCANTCLSLQFEGDRGYTIKLNQSVVVSGYLGGAIRDNRDGVGNFEGRLTLNAVASITEDLRARFEYHHKKQLDEERLSKNNYRFDIRYQLATNWDVRFVYEYEGSGRSSLLFGHYW